MKHAGDAGSRNHSGAVTAQDHGIRHHIGGPYHLPADYRQPVADKILQQLAVRLQKVAEFQPQLLVYGKHINHAHSRLQNAGNQRGDRRTLDAHGRKAQLTEN